MKENLLRKRFYKPNAAGTEQSIKSMKENAHDIFGNIKKAWNPIIKELNQGSMALEKSKPNHQALGRKRGLQFTIILAERKL
jgi:hypothetical protein